MNNILSKLSKHDRLKVVITASIVSLLLLLSIVPIPEKVYIGTNYMIATSASNGIGVVYPFYTPSYRLNYTITSADERSALEEIYYSVIPGIHQRLDRHHTYFKDDAVGVSSGYVSNLALLNESYGTLDGIPYDAKLWEYLQQGITLTEQTQGSFHMAIGALSDFWNDILVSPALTDESLDPLNDHLRATKLDTLLACLPPSDEMRSLIRLNEAGTRIIFDTYYSPILGRDCLTTELSITYGALGKGIANDALQSLLLENGLDNGVIYGGASSMTMMRGRWVTNPWRVAMAYPFGYGEDLRAEVLATIVNNRAFSISQSGSYEGGYVSYFDTETNDWERVWRHHIIDPQTGYPLDSHHAVMVFTETALHSGYLDALSTSLMNLSIEAGAALLEQLPFEVEAMWVLQTTRSTADLTATAKLSSMLDIGPGVTLITI